MDTLAMIKSPIGGWASTHPMRRPTSGYASVGTPSHVSVRVRDSLRKKRALYTINSMIVQKFLPCLESRIESRFSSPKTASIRFTSTLAIDLREDI
jgi:hypothetical protein